MKLLTLKRDVISQMSAPNFLNGPRKTGARSPGSREHSGTPPRRTLSSPSRPASQKARDSACVTASSGSRRKFFKHRKSRLAFSLTRRRGAGLPERDGAERDGGGARAKIPVGALRWGLALGAGDELFLPGSGWKWGRRCYEFGPASLFFL